MKPTGMKLIPEKMLFLSGLPLIGSNEVWSTPLTGLINKLLVQALKNYGFRQARKGTLKGLLRKRWKEGIIHAPAIKAKL